MQNINVGIIGFGLSGRYFFAPYIDHHFGLNLYGICSSQSEAIYDSYPGVRVFKSVTDLLACGDIDLIVVASPNDTHFDYARKSLLAKKHVIIEKPFTVNSSEAEELTAMAEKARLVLAPFHNRRWDGDFLTVKSIIEEEKLGPLLDYESHFDRYRPLYERAPWKNKPTEGNGIVYDLGPHLIDQATSLFGKPEAVFAHIHAQRLNGQIDDNFNIHLYYPGLKAVLKASAFVRESGPRFMLHGRLGSFVKYGLDPQEEQLKSGIKPGNPLLGQESENLFGVIHTELNGTPFREKVETQKGRYMEYFNSVYNAITGKGKLVITPSDATLVIRIIETAYQSSREKRLVTFV